MKRFACGDIVPGYRAGRASSNEDKILVRVAEHGELAQGITRIDDELVTALRAHTVGVA